jgi:hypothetical protein
VSTALAVIIHDSQSAPGYRDDDCNYNPGGGLLHGDPPFAVPIPCLMPRFLVLPPQVVQKCATGGFVWLNGEHSG